MNNECKYANLDAQNGFQDVPPILITTLTEIIANIVSGRMPVNLANSFGNWIQLVAQVIAVYNSQQQYQQSGPGRSFDPAYKNIDNPFCENQSKLDGAEQVAKVKKKNKKTNNIREDNTGEIKEIIIALQKENEELKRELQELRDMIISIKG